MDQNAKQQAVETIKQAVNVLVTVSANPSVDQLSAALGLTLMLGKLDKHATAVFSGSVPQAINFLEPDKTFEGNVDSLRDFIIALDKQKADKLRYKVEDDVVKIFITPYHTKITKNDFDFSQGDFNIDAVVALGVSDREDLDNAIKSHGRILHDATVVTVNSGPNQSKLGAINWSDDTASSLCEMLVSVSESFGSGLLDQQISTAFLTGIVAATERFSNNKTSPKVMTMSAQLMAAGANQQLIANELQIKQTVSVQSTQKKSDAPEVKNMQEIDLGKNKAPNSSSSGLPSPADTSASPLSHADDETASLKKLEGEIAALGEDARSANGSSSKVETVLDQKSSLGTDHPAIAKARSEGLALDQDIKPEMGGTFNATTTQAHEDLELQRSRELNKSILQHNSASSDEKTNPTVHTQKINPPSTVDSALVPLESQQQTPPADIDTARKAVNSAVASQPFDPANHPLESLGSQPLSPDKNVDQQIDIDDNGKISKVDTANQKGANGQLPTAL